MLRLVDVTASAVCIGPVDVILESQRERDKT